MSSMLEQAIIDAEALKEAAIKNAEAAIIEKYSRDIKNAVDYLLEAEGEEDDLGLEDLGAGDEIGDMSMSPPEDVLPGVTSAVTDGEKLCPCPDDGEEIVVDFNQLAAMADAEMGGDMNAPGSTEPDMGLDMDGLLDDEEEEEVPLTEELIASTIEEVFGLSKEGKNPFKKDDKKNKLMVDEEEEEDEELSEEFINSAIEEAIEEVLRVDIKPVPSGTVMGAQANPVELKAQEDAIIARMRDTEFAKKEKERLKAVKDLKDLQEKYEAKNQKIDDAMKVISRLQEKLNQTNILNAKLLYTNKILNSDSLNERQKEKVVEAISRAGTVEEAKMIFETLQSTVQSSRDKRQPKSLSEAVVRNSSTFMPRRTEVLQESQLPEVDRWAILAGIKK